MAILVLLVPAERKLCLRAEVLSRLRSLGVTQVSLLHDQRSLGVVVEGWAFDPIGSAEAVIEAVAGGHGRPRTLQPLVEMTLLQGGD